MNPKDRDAVRYLGELRQPDDSPHFSGSSYHSLIASVMRSLHSRIPAGDAPDLGRPAHVEIRDEYFRGKNVKRAVVFLLTNGCEWALRSANGCTMCGHIAKQVRTKEPIPATHFVHQFTAALSSTDFNGIPVLNVFNNGSFFNDAEIPTDARRSILRMAGQADPIKKVLVECRPEFVTDDVLSEATDLLNGTELEVAIGLETSDDYIRSVSINKGFSLSEFVRAANIVKKHGVTLRSYILLKPPFCTERDAIEDAVRSIEHAFSLGVDTVSLEGMTVQDFTLIEYLYRRKLYALPWLWSIVDVVRRTAHQGDVVVGLFKFYPSPETVPANCTFCNERVMGAIMRYNATRRADVFDGVDCECRAAWAAVLKDDRDRSQLLQEFVRVAQSEEAENSL